MYHELIVAELRKVLPESYHEFNPNNPPVFPYSVYFVVLNQHTEQNQFMGNLEIELISDSGDDRETLEQIALDMTAAMDNLTVFNSRWFVTFWFAELRTIPTMDNIINHKTLTMRIKIDDRGVN